MAGICAAPPSTRLLAPLQVFHCDDGLHRARTGNDDVCLAQHLFERIHQARLSAHLRRQSFHLLLRTTHHGQAGSGIAKETRHRLSHIARANQRRTPAPQISENLTG
jgi:hypothetical protein